MLTVMVGLDESGKTRNFKPLSSRYSVIPSTEVTFVTPFGIVWEKTKEDGRKAATAVTAARRRKFMGCWGSFEQSITAKEPQPCKRGVNCLRCANRYFRGA